MRNENKWLIRRETWSNPSRFQKSGDSVICALYEYEDPFLNGDVINLFGPKKITTSRNIGHRATMLCVNLLNSLNRSSFCARQSILICNYTSPGNIGPNLTKFHRFKKSIDIWRQIPNRPQYCGFFLQINVFRWPSKILAFSNLFQIPCPLVLS